MPPQRVITLGLAAETPQFEMVQRVRSFPWHETPLGAQEKWPESLRTAVDICLHSRFPLWIGWGPELRMIYNDAFKEVLRVKHPWALGRPTKEIWSEVWDVIGPMLQSVMDSGNPTWSNDQLLVLERSGLPEETYFTWSYSPIYLESGKMGGIFTTVKETTERVLGERRLGTLRELGLPTADEGPMEAARRATSVLGSNTHEVPFAALYLIENNRTDAVLAGVSGLPEGSPARPERVRLGSSAPWPFPTADAGTDAIFVETLSPDIGSLPAGPWHEPAKSAMILPLRSAGRDEAMGYLVAGLSPRRPLDSDYRTFLDLVARHISSSINNARAISEERRRAQALAQLDRAKTEFFSNISHEFRTPLTLMLGPLQDLLAAGGLDADQRTQLEMAQRNSLRLLKLVNNLLDFSRLEAGRSRATFVPTPFSAFVADLASNFRPVAERADLDLRIECPPLPRPVYLDRDMSERVVLNLLSNAFKFTFDGSITVRVRDEGDHVALEVADTGVGIPEQELPRIFERFHRVEGTRSRTHEGSGIGLSLVKELVGLHGGTVSVASRLEVGSTFTVHIPYGPSHLPSDLVRDSAVASPQDNPAAYAYEAERWVDGPAEIPAIPTGDEGIGASTATQGAELLLVEDNADMRDYLRRILSTRWRIRTVRDGQEALDAIREKAPDLVLSDIMMPRMNGYEMLGRLRDDPATHNLPVILISARAGDDARAEGLEKGADDYLAKPFTARELMARVNTHLTLSRAKANALALERSSREALERVNADLEAAVMQRTRDLQARALHLEQANASLARLSYVLGHDLQEPVRAVGAVLRVLRDDFGAHLPSLFREHLAAAEHANERLGRLVSGLLRFSRASHTPLGPTDLTRLMDVVNDPNFAAGISEADRRNRLKVVGGDAPLFVSKPDLAKVLNQLVVNALQHGAREDRPVQIRAIATPSWTQIHVEDNGPGFPAAVTDDFNSGGLGTRDGNFGLAIARRTVERMGGTITIKTSSMGGASVELNLPSEALAVPALHSGDQVGSARTSTDLQQAYESLVRSIPGAFFRCDVNQPWRFSVMTRQVEAITGYPAAEFTERGRAWATIMHPDDVDRVAGLVEPAITGRRPYSAEYRIFHARGGIRWVLDRGSAVYDAAGNPIALEGLVFDITEGKRNEEELRESRTRFRETSEDLMTFTNSVSHDLRTPLRVIDFHLSQLVSGLRSQGDPTLLGLATSAAAETRRVSRLIADLLAFSRGGHKPLELRSVDVTRLCTEAVDSIRGSLPGPGPTWTFQPGLRAYGDEGLMRILLQTLLHNAAKYTSDRPAPQVWVSGEEATEGTWIRVRDNGIGFPASEADRLFAPFVRLSTATDFEGTGLGLTTAKRIVSRHGGLIRASAEPGKGALFEIFLPNARASSLAPEEPKDREIVASASPKA